MFESLGNLPLPPNIEDIYQNVGMTKFFDWQKECLSENAEIKKPFY